ncbi:alpha/beta hydrolase [Phytomonospora sp. NPDC050363]|uniref:alpha/beta hydrolase n=1 Tax=Phytomonospora sp. NPDC050363 TaxID=3155642 RepID=UPI003406BD42
MIVLYVLSTTLVGCCALAALAPPRRPWPLAVAAFWVGLPVGELPFPALYWLAVTTVLADAGPLAMAWAGLVAVLLVVLVVRAARTPRVVGEALAAVGISARPRVAWAAALTAPFVRRARGVVRETAVRYGDDPLANLLDVYRPVGPVEGGRPVLVYFHGGSYSGGRRSREALPLFHRLVRRGWVCVSADYRLRPSARFGDHLSDAKRVLAWVGKEGPAYGADAAKVFVAGGSAGAHLAALTALTPNDPRAQGGFEEADTSVAGVVCLYGFYGRYWGDAGDARGLPTSPPAARLSGAPPFFVAHGEKDTVVPVGEARRFAGALRKASVPVVYAELPGGQHGFDLFASVRFGAVADGVVAFLTWSAGNRR